MWNLNFECIFQIYFPSQVTFLLCIYSQMSAIIEDVSKGKQEEKISVFPALLGNEIEHHTVLKKNQNLFVYYAVPLPGSSLPKKTLILLIIK